jgi:hypothetical protein
MWTEAEKARLWEELQEIRRVLVTHSGRLNELEALARAERKTTAAVPYLGTSKGRIDAQ